ncbi:hypothetical protein G6F37_003021 [Rhizopus arrhizus]|nr:hypothetical protein G6F38_003183 [Rhizopus arrhizus]KAG1161506.1 hypothetical protein G6F37_003021 [Rhizopus arrhizus]
MRLSLISFGLSSVFMIVSSLPLGSVELEKRQGFGVDVAANAVQNVAGAAEQAAGQAYGFIQAAGAAGQAAGAFP